MVKRGFTIVEMIVVITIIGILLILGVVNMTSTQANARNSERKSDIETIATALESVYRSGYTNIAGSQKIGQYPSTLDIADPTKILKDIDTNALKAPDTSSISLMAATDTSTTLPRATISKDQYIYQPLTKDGLLCDDGSKECRKFNIYCVLENGTLCPLITSKHQ
jgi:prepilin-type N-terminal cleavage/methylation domain-containing protein